VGFLRCFFLTVYDITRTITNLEQRARFCSHPARLRFSPDIPIGSVRRCSTRKNTNIFASNSSDENGIRRSYIERAVLKMTTRMEYGSRIFGRVSFLVSNFFFCVCALYRPGTPLQFLKKRIYFLLSNIILISPVVNFINVSHTFSTIYCRFQIVN